MSKSSFQVITCKAAVCWGPEEPLKVEDIQVELPKSSEIRVKMLYASVCSSDILCTKGFPIPIFPRVLGHEGVGVVESVGDEVKEVKEGDMVIPSFIGECRECDNCLSGKTNLCLKYPLILNGLMLDGTSRLSVRGQKLYHSFTCGTWAEYIVIDANYVVKIDPSFHLPFASFISCGYSTGFGSAWKEAKVEKGSSVAVIGLGAVGLGVIEGARIQGATKIIGIDINDRKREKGQAFGMTDFIHSGHESDKPISELVKDLSGGFGVDYCFECTGVPGLVNEALLSAKIGAGKTILVGATEEATVPIIFLPLLCGGTLKGTVFGGLKIKSDLPFIFDKCHNKELHLHELLTHQVSMAEMDKILQLAKQQDCVKILIKF
ncbi:hypothetical protein K2173_004489 [Erythroxylum novogranatense]|uniref:Alcohol dehydrogenase n=1 Tax=Erythroxylum novogranatense TaxID=1862640 RepID=A0AAV8T586_9ROSI|nr:hypothetical protein K2173_004489 [Erythroxylum novogranatense]